MKKFIPIAVFVLLVGLLGFGLTNDPKKVPSPLINKAAPTFSSSTLFEQQSFSSEQMRGKVWLLNVFASWCPSCRQEHHNINQFVMNNKTPVIGLNYKDEISDAEQFLEQFGNPYQLVALDPQGQVGMDYGVYATPETFLIDKKGMIRYKKIGPLSEQDLTQEIPKLIAQLEAESAK